MITSPIGWCRDNPQAGGVPRGHGEIPLMFTPIFLVRLRQCRVWAIGHPGPGLTRSAQIGAGLGLGFKRFLPDIRSQSRRETLLK